MLHFVTETQRPARIVWYIVSLFLSFGATHILCYDELMIPHYAINRHRLLQRLAAGRYDVLRFERIFNQNDVYLLVIDGVAYTIWTNSKGIALSTADFEEHDLIGLWKMSPLQRWQTRKINALLNQVKSKQNETI